MGAVPNLEVIGQNVKDQRREILELKINKRKYPVQKAKGSAKNYIET